MNNTALYPKGVAINHRIWGSLQRKGNKQTKKKEKRKRKMCKHIFLVFVPLNNLI